LKCARYDGNIKGVDASEFPIIPTIGEGKKFSIDPEVLREMIEQTTVAAANDDSRPVLTGVYTRIEKNGVLLAAADGFRLSVRSAPLESGLDSLVAVIVPAKSMAEVSRILGDQEEPVEIAVTDNRSQILFHLENTDLVSQLIDGNFPDYNQILPKSHNTRTVMNTGDLQSAVKAAAVFAREASNIVRLNISPTNEQGAGRVVVAATSAETGDDVGEIDAQVTGEPLEIAFNARYLENVLGVLHAPQVSLETTTAASPGVIRPMGRDDFTHVIMPMHIGR
ncbi:MAG: DNA polymerase III subunit beta, partial [Rudaea sp.]